MFSILINKLVDIIICTKLVDILICTNCYRNMDFREYDVQHTNQ